MTLKGWTRIGARVLPRRVEDRWDTQPFTYTPESVAEIVAATYQPLGPWFRYHPTASMPKIFLFLNRITIGVSSILGISMPPPTGSSIDSESATTDRRPQNWVVWKPPGRPSGTAASPALTSTAHLARRLPSRFSVELGPIARWERRRRRSTERLDRASTENLEGSRLAKMGRAGQGRAGGGAPTGAPAASRHPVLWSAVRRGGSRSRSTSVGGGIEMPSMELTPMVMRLRKRRSLGIESRRVISNHGPNGWYVAATISATDSGV